MPNSVLQYNLSADYIETIGHTSLSVYQFLGRRDKAPILLLRANGKGYKDVFNDASDIANSLKT